MIFTFTVGCNWKPTVMCMPPYIKQTTGHIHWSHPPTNSHICWATRNLHSGVALISKLFSGLHVPRVKETPSLGFFGHGLLLSEVQLNFHVTTPINYRLNWVYPQKDSEWCQIFTPALMCPRDKNFMEVDKKIYWVQNEIHPFVSISTQKNIINKKLIRKT